MATHLRFGAHFIVDGSGFVLVSDSPVRRYLHELQALDAALGSLHLSALVATFANRLCWPRSYISRQAEAAIEVSCSLGDGAASDCDRKCI